MQVHPVLASLDTDGNGEISRGEWRGESMDFRTADRNGDNRITRDEYVNRPNDGYGYNSGTGMDRMQARFSRSDPAKWDQRAKPLVERFDGPLVDVGSGGGAPGIPLAHVLPEREVVLLEAERRKGNVTERVMRASAGSYVISPAALTGLQPDPRRSPDQRSAVWLLALAARLVRDVGVLLTGANRERRPLSTFALDAEVRFASAADRAAFADELGAAVTSLIGRYHDDAAPRGRTHRVLVAIHPSVPTHAPSTAPQEA
jgi:hypothetical protein